MSKLPPLHVADCPMTNEGAPASEDSVCVCEHWDTPRYYIEGGGGTYTTIPEYPVEKVLGEYPQDGLCGECGHHHYTQHPTHYHHEPQKGDIWKHYKGGTYEVLEFARHSEGKGMHIVYRDYFNHSKVWVRPYRMWRELVDPHSYNSAELDQGVEKGMVPRFSLEHRAGMKS